MEFSDKVLKCADCGQEFIFTAGEQLFFFDRQFKNDPKRCKNCKAKRSGQYTGKAATRSETRTKCSQCGTETTVPFKPTQGRPVLCRQCFQMKKIEGDHPVVTAPLAQA
jgi:CxxC-x17-CxxC domain-containing protein